MALSACGAPVGGSARESNDAPAKGTLRAAECRRKCDPPRSNKCASREPISRTQPGRIDVEGKRGRRKLVGTANERGRRTGTALETRASLRRHARGSPDILSASGQ
jgi:hypothetical protein